MCVDKWILLIMVDFQDVKVPSKIQLLSIFRLFRQLRVRRVYLQVTISWMIKRNFNARTALAFTHCYLYEYEKCNTMVSWFLKLVGAGWYLCQYFFSVANKVLVNDTMCNVGNDKTAAANVCICKCFWQVCTMHLFCCFLHLYTFFSFLLQQLCIHFSYWATEQ